MADFNEKDLDKLARLSRIKCSEEEQKKLLQGLKRIVGYVDELKEVDTEDVPACNHVLETMVNVMRDDLAKGSLPRELFLENAPSHVGGMIRVPPVIKFE